jgi:hypothetical protein
MNVHWTDQKSHDMEYGNEEAPGEVLRDKRRERIRRTGFANNILSFYGLKLSEWNGIRYILSDKKGTQKIIGDLGELWPEAQKLCGNRIDPLDPCLLAYLPTLDDGHGHKQE